MIIAIIGVMVTVGVVSFSAGEGAARVKGATRDIFGAIRHARSVALVTGKPAIVTYSTETVDGIVQAKIDVTTVKLMDTGIDRSKVETLSGDPLKGEKFELVHIEGERPKGGTGEKAEGEEKPEGDGKAEGGESIEEILFAPVKADVVRGMRLKVVKGDEDIRQEDTGRKTKISVFSNVDYLIGKFKGAKAEAKRKELESKPSEGDSSGDAPLDEDQEPVSIVWETNGRVEPHQVWVYADGQKPEDGLMIRIDRFGAAKVMNGDGRDED